MVKKIHDLKEVGNSWNLNMTLDGLKEGFGILLYKVLRGCRNAITFFFSPLGQPLPLMS